MPKRFTGVLAPVVMPYKDDYTPDARLLIKQCEWLLAQNVGLAVFGTNSEGNSLSTEEKINLIDLLVVAGIDPNQMMPGTGCCALSDSIRLTSHAIEAGCGGVLMLPPFFYKNVTDDGLYGSYSEIIQRVGSSKLRLYLYHIPQVANVPISLNLIERLLRDYPNTVVGIKDSSGDWENTKAMLDQKWNNFRVFVGSETFLLKNMLHGGAGCISATANVNPEAIYQAFTNWKSENADKVQAELNKVRDLFVKYPVIPALKQCVAHFSEQPSWKRLRPPLIELNEAQTKALINDLQTINFNMPGIK
ncbi:MAG: dihydrodipicolinate synthase family protein [Pseudomonadota bacterium]|nr:dihydrodipicolinate synthase family protein [Pseudomonadota bacterium]